LIDVVSTAAIQVTGAAALLRGPDRGAAAVGGGADRAAMDVRRDPATSTGAIKQVADQLGVHRKLGVHRRRVRNWVWQAEIAGGLGSVPPATTRPGSPS